MGEVVKTKVGARQPVNLNNPASAASELYKKIENPQSIKDYYVNNLISAIEKNDRGYNGTNGDRDRLADLLTAQVVETRRNGGVALINDKTNDIFEKCLATKDSVTLKAGRKMVLEDFLPKSYNFPLDNPKLAAEFIATVTQSLDTAIRTRAQEVGAVTATKAPQTPAQLQTANTTANTKEAGVLAPAIK